MKKLLTVLLVTLTLFTMTGCFASVMPENNANTEKQAEETATAKEEAIKDYDSYVENGNYKEMGLEELKLALQPEADFTGVILMSRNNCPYCQRLMPILTSLTKNENIPIYYADTNKIKESDEYNPEIKFQEVVDLIPDQLIDAGSVNDDGEPAIYVPLLIFVKLGEVKSVRMGLINDETYDVSQPLSPEQFAQVYNEIKTYTDIVQGK